MPKKNLEAECDFEGCGWRSKGELVWGPENRYPMGVYQQSQLATAFHNHATERGHLQTRLYTREDGSDLVQVGALFLAIGGVRATFIGRGHH